MKEKETVDIDFSKHYRRIAVRIYNNVRLEVECLSVQLDKKHLRSE